MFILFKNLKPNKLCLKNIQLFLRVNLNRRQIKVISSILSAVEAHILSSSKPTFRTVELKKDVKASVRLKLVEL